MLSCCSLCSILFTLSKKFHVPYLEITISKLAIFFKQGEIIPAMKKTTSSRLSTSSLIQAACLCLLAVMLSSCASSVGLGGGRSSFASTTINNSTRSTVDAAIRAVFQEEGFTFVSQGPYDMHFRKMGGDSAKLIYGSWFSEGVSAEPEIIVVDRGSGNFAVHCDVYMREHSGSDLLDANWKLRGSGKVAYNRLMGRIKKMAEGQ